jgi:hypothetical protein
MHNDRARILYSGWSEPRITMFRRHIQSRRSGNMHNMPDRDVLKLSIHYTSKAGWCMHDMPKRENYRKYRCKKHRRM